VLTAGGAAVDPTRGVHCNSDGDYGLVLEDGSTATFTMLGGILYPYRVTQLTSGSNLIGVY